MQETTHDKIDFHTTSIHNNELINHLGDTRLKVIFVIYFTTGTLEITV